MDTKPVWQSQTLIGIAILVIPSTLRLIDSWFGTRLDNPNIDTICTTIGTFLGVNGRLSATTKLK
jgi:hypothetical protein